MCRLGAILNIQNDTPEVRELIEQVTKLMLAKMAEGNPHGAGVGLSYHDNPGYHMLKTPHSGLVLAESLELDKSKAFKHVLMHTRYATQGKISELNSHPHASDTGILVHNGWCPELYDSIQNGWHQNTEEFQQRLTETNGTPSFISECDSEALSLVFDPNPAKFTENLTGDEVFALFHMDNTGDNVTLFTQYNTVHMAYSHALGAVICSTTADVVEAALDFLGEKWPVACVGHDQVYYFDGEDMLGDKFDFTEAAMENMEKHYAKRKVKSMTVYNGNLEEINDETSLEQYFSSSFAQDKEWQRTELPSGEVVWEHYSGEIIHVPSGEEDLEMNLERYYENMPEEAEYESVNDSDEYLDKDFKKVQKQILDQIIAEAVKMKA